MNEVMALIGVGSNIAPFKYIPAAFTLLKQRQRIIASSTFYQTEPLGRPDQPAFINGVWAIQTTTPPLRLQKQLHDIEDQLGRIRTSDKYAPRVIDLDLILHGREQCHTQKLTLPHPDLNRAFVLGPTVELITALNLQGFNCQLPNTPPTPQEIGQPLTDLTKQLQRHCCP